MSIVLDGTTGITTPGLTNTGTETIVNLTTTGNTILGDASTDTLNVGNGGLVKDASGNLGIGTTTPTGGANRVVDVYGSGSSAINFHNATSGTTATDGGVIGQYGSDLVLYNYEAGIIQFGTSNTERARIDSSGNLLVGTTTSTGVSGVGIGFLPGFSTSGVSMVCRTGTAANNDNVYFYTTSGLAGYIRTNGTTTTYASVSDERLKENIANADSAAEKVQQIQVRKFDWKSGDGHVDYGFIAQELNLVAPQAVAEGTKENDVWAVDSSMLVPLLTKAIQEQQALITTLTDRITALETPTGTQA